MAAYRRFVIYLYWCQKEKVQNVGFAKMELQNNQCRIEIHLKGLAQEEMALPVYLFSREEHPEEENVLWGVELGKIEIKRGTGKFGRIFPTEKIGDSPFHYQDMNGLLIPLNVEEMVAGQWDKKDIIQQQFRVWQPEQASSTEETHPTEESSIIKEKKSAEESSTTREKATAGESPMTREKATAGESPIVKRNEPAGESSIATKNKPAEESPMAKKNELPEESSIEKKNESLERENTLRVQQLAVDFNQKKQKTVQKIAFPREIASDWEQMWNMLSSSRESFAPIEGKEITAVKIDLKDLHLLPEELWNLGNNSFLLHGFFNYRFLLYGKIYQEDNAPYYFIGIPGVFSNQEKVLAAIFGFPEFYLEKKSEIRTGKSGYWCKLLMSSDNNAYK